MEKQTERNLRILHVITRLDLGGSAENTLLTAIGLVEKGYSVDLLAGSSDIPPSDTERTAIDHGVAIERLGSLRRNISPFMDVIALWQIYSRMKRGRYDLVHTHTSKAGILGLTRCAALEVATNGITCNSISPGWVETDMTLDWVKKQAADHSHSWEEQLEELKQQVNPQQRLIQPSEVAALVVFLCREEARAITMQDLTIAAGGLW